MISLFIDTCNKQIVIGLLEDLNLIDEMKFINDNDLSEKLLPSIKELLSKNNTKINDLNRVYVSVGPGSFTGIRIGVTVAKTIAWALKIDIIPVSSLEVMASVDMDDDICSLVDARRGYVYAGCYDKELNNIFKDEYILLSDLKKKLEDKKITYLSYDNFDFETGVPDINITKVIKKHMNDEPLNPHMVNPVYLKRTEAEEKNDKNS